MTNFSYQLYSSRNFQPLTDTYKMLASLGYSGVEAYSDLVTNGDPVKFLADVEANGLYLKTCHFGLEFIEADINAAVDLAKTLKLERVYVPYLLEEKRPTEADGWIALGQKLDQMSKPFKDAGFGFGWHNHDFEFIKLSSGELPMELILSAAKGLEIEFDVAWAVRANYSPSEFIEKFGSQITSVHVKDIAPNGECTDEDGWADVGQGVVDWANIFGQIKTSTPATHFIMEHDNPSDHQRFAQRSIDAVKAL